MPADTPPVDVQELWHEQTTEAFRMSADEIHARIARFSRKSRRAIFDGFLVCAFIVLGYIGFLALFHNPLLRIGSILVIAAFGFLAWQVRSNQLAERAAAQRAAEMGTMDSVDFHRGQWLRQRDRHTGTQFWSRWLILLPGAPVFFIGFAQERPELTAIIWVEAITFLIAIAAAIPLNRRAVRNCQRQIDELDQLRKENS